MFLLEPGWFGLGGRCQRGDHQSAVGFLENEPKPWPGRHEVEVRVVNRDVDNV